MKRQRSLVSDVYLDRSTPFSLRASSPIWASEASRARTRERGAPRGFAARSRVLARLVSLAQIGELARRLTQHARIDFALFIAFSILRRYLAFGENAAKKKRKEKLVSVFVIETESEKEIEERV